MEYSCSKVRRSPTHEAVESVTELKNLEASTGRPSGNSHTPVSTTRQWIVRGAIEFVTSEGFCSFTSNESLDTVLIRTTVGNSDVAPSYLTEHVATGSLKDDDKETVLQDVVDTDETMTDSRKPRLLYWLKSVVGDGVGASVITSSFVKTQALLERLQLIMVEGSLSSHSESLWQFIAVK